MKVKRKHHNCKNCKAFPCLPHMNQSGWGVRGRRFVKIRTTEKEQREYFASLLPEWGCPSFE